MSLRQTIHDLFHNRGPSKQQVQEVFRPAHDAADKLNDNLDKVLDTLRKKKERKDAQD